LAVISFSPWRTRELVAPEEQGSLCFAPAKQKNGFSGYIGVGPAHRDNTYGVIIARPLELYGVAQKTGYNLGIMAEEITVEIFNHLVELAALELSSEESEYLRGQLNNQLKAVHELEAIPLDPATPVASHGVPYTPENIPPIRRDEWAPYPAPDDILAQAPETDEGYIVVPEIPHTELE
jgi:aspartyl/glutamyl-tRNA(Asn/Gln) amidotransferase C subunit